MNGPLEFLHIFVERLREANIRFAITSGMACVHYGLQHNTKDSDWIFCVEDIDLLRDFLIKAEGELPPWRVSYRPVFGAAAPDRAANLAMRQQGTIRSLPKRMEGILPPMADSIRLGLAGGRCVLEAAPTGHECVCQLCPS